MLNRNDHRIELIVNEAQKAWSFLLYILPPAGIGWFSVVTHLTLSNAHEKEAPKKTTVAAVVGRTGRSTRLAEWREESFPNFFVKRRERETGSRGLGWGPSAGIFSRARPSSNASNTCMQQMLRGKAKKITKRKLNKKFLFLFEKRCPSHQTGSGEDDPFRFQPLVGTTTTTTCRRAFVSLTSIEGKQNDVLASQPAYTVQQHSAARMEASPSSSSRSRSRGDRKCCYTF